MSVPWLLRHPKSVLAVAAVLLASLAAIGVGVEDRLDPTTLDVPGTESLRAGEMAREHFGDSAPFAILLRGPSEAIDRQGPRLVRALRAHDPRVTTLSPWDRGAVQRLRSRPGRALILVDFHVDTRTAVNDTVPELNRILAENVRPPVRAVQSGYATLSRAIQDESIEASQRGELIALPFLLIVLLLVFRSPIAAAIPLAFGTITVVASRGILHFFTSWFDIDAFALTVCSMMGLALGVDYALLMVSRFREELERGTPVLEAARITRRTSGRTVMFAGSTLLLSMIVSLFILPGSLLASLAGTVIMVVLLSVVVATVVGPALLTLIGPRVDLWRVGRRGEGGSRLMTLVGAALRKPAVATILIGGVLAALAAPAIALKTGPPSPAQLPKDAQARKDAELIDRAMGPGWSAPFRVIAVRRDGPITASHTLADLTEFQRKLARLPDVQAVVGPAQVTRPVGRLQDLGNAVLTQEGNIGPVKQLGRLGRSLDVAARGVGQLRAGIEEAGEGAGLLALGSDRAGEGAEMIALGLATAARGSGRAIDALDRFAKGSERLAEAVRNAATGALALKFGAQAQGGHNLRYNGIRRQRKLENWLKEDAEGTLPRLLGPARAADERLRGALADLEAMTVGRTDPRYDAAREAVRGALAAVSGTDPQTGAPFADGYAGLPAELEALQGRLERDVGEAHYVLNWMRGMLPELKKLENGAGRLQEGLLKIHAGAVQLQKGAERLSSEATSLGDGLKRLSDGAVELVGGIERLGGGAEALRTALLDGAARSAPLESGLEEATVRVLDGRKRIRGQARRLRRAAPGIFNSGYFVLSALDGAAPRNREAAATTVDLKNGGAASMLVISHHSFNTPGSIALNKRLNREAEQFERESGLKAGVAGGAAQLNDYSRVTRERIPWVVVAITIATFLVLVIVLRSVPVAAIAVGLNLLTVAVAFGVLTLLFELPDDWPLGGRTYVDAVGATMIFGLVFGLSIDYAVFLLMRMREHYDANGDSDAAVRFGLSKTAGVITGAAAIMMAVFIAFAGAPIATVSQLGVGLTVAVLLDATVVRIVLLPALMLLLGDRVWWFPRPLARVVPKLHV